jgi:raffinose/stachyose/melibiose transport system substrate-binding protein
MKKRIAMAICLAALLAPAFVLPAQGKTALTLWAFAGPDDSSEENAYLRELVAGFAKDNPDVAIDWRAYGVEGAEAVEKINRALEEGTAPDVFQAWGGASLAAAAAKGRLLDLSQELAGLPVNPAVQSLMQAGGKTFGVIPFFSAAGLYVNEGKLKALKLDVPRTLDELEKTAAALKAAGLQPFALGASDRWPLVFTFMYLALDRDPAAFERAVRRRALRFDAEPFAGAALTIQRWAKNGWFGKDPGAEGYGAAIDLMGGGRAGLQVSGSWLNRSYANPELSREAIGFYEFPPERELEQGERTVVGGTDVGFAASGTAAPKKDAIVRFFRYAMTKTVCERDRIHRTCAVPGVNAPDRLTGMTNAVLARAGRVEFFVDQELPADLVDPFFGMLASFLKPATDVRKNLARFEDMLAKEAGPVKQ